MLFNYKLTLCDLKMGEIINIMVDEKLTDINDFIKDRELYIRKYFPERVDEHFKV